MLRQRTAAVQVRQRISAPDDRSRHQTRQRSLAEDSPTGRNQGIKLNCDQAEGRQTHRHHRTHASSQNSQERIKQPAIKDRQRGANGMGRIYELRRNPMLADIFSVRVDDPEMSHPVSVKMPVGIEQQRQRRHHRNTIADTAKDSRNRWGRRLHGADVEAGADVASCPARSRPTVQASVTKRTRPNTTCEIRFNANQRGSGRQIARNSCLPAGR